MMKMTMLLQGRNVTMEVRISAVGIVIIQEGIHTTVDPTMYHLFEIMSSSDNFWN